MSNFKGTKGPWFPVDYAGRFIIQTEDSYSDSDDVFESDDFSYEEVKANSKLASKAPEMLEILEDILNVIDWSTEHWQGNGGKEREQKIKQLIKEATEI